MIKQLGLLSKLLVAKASCILNKPFESWLQILPIGYVIAP